MSSILQQQLVVLPEKHKKTTSVIGATTAPADVGAAASPMDFGAAAAMAHVGTETPTTAKQSGEKTKSKAGDNLDPIPINMSEEEGKKSRVPTNHQTSPSAPPPPPPYNYYGTFQGVANHPQQPYPPPPSLQQQTYQPPLGFPQPSPPLHNNSHPYYHHGYQTTVPVIVIAPGTPVLIERRTLPCCGCGIGWFLFFIGFFCGAIPWYIGAFILLCVRVDYREKAGLVACTIAAFLVLIAVGLGVQRAKYDW